MLCSVFLYLSLGLTAAAAFKVTLFETANCTGSKTTDLGDIKVANGCQKLGLDKKSIKFEWVDEADNALQFTTFDGDKCCVANFASATIWQDECVDLFEERSFDMSFRVINPENVEEGKQGEDYGCVDIMIRENDMLGIGNGVERGNIDRRV